MKLKLISIRRMSHLHLTFRTRYMYETSKDSSSCYNCDHCIGADQTSREYLCDYFNVGVEFGDGEDDQIPCSTFKKYTTKRL